MVPVRGLGAFKQLLVKNKGNVTSSGWRKMLLIFSGLQTFEEFSNFHLLLRQANTHLLMVSKWKTPLDPSVRV